MRAAKRVSESCVYVKRGKKSKYKIKARGEKKKYKQQRTHTQVDCIQCARRVQQRVYYSVVAHSCAQVGINYSGRVKKRD